MPLACLSKAGELAASGKSEAEIKEKIEKSREKTKNFLKSRK